MKRRITILLILLLSTIVVSAQKKVAVWDVQALSENVTPMNKLQIQGAMEKAIANAEGYEAYNRNALETIMAEQNFQRGGNVSDEQIRAIGKMAGVDYILLVQAAKEENEIFVTANILDIETGKYGDSDNELMNAKGQEIQVGCCNLACRLFNVSMVCGSTATTTKAPVAKQPTPKTSTPKQSTVVSRTPAPKQTLHEGNSAVNIDGFEMIYVEGGTFAMGTNTPSNKYEKQATPAHNVTLSGFYIGKYEVTRKQWKTVMGKKWKPDDENIAINNVSYDDIQNFINRLNAITSKKFRLPTEAEWEYAARGGAYSQGYTYSGSNNPNAVCELIMIEVPVGKYASNELGLYDMSGGLWEWCSDYYQKGYFPEDQTNPRGPYSGQQHVIRGGCRFQNISENTVFARKSLFPTISSYDVGFRLVVEAE